MLSRFVENAALESVAQELIQQAHMMVNEKHFNALHLKIKIQIVVQCLIRNQNRCFIYLVAFLSSYHEKATERCTSLLWSCCNFHFAYKCFFPQLNKLALELPAICLSHQDEGIPLCAFPNS